MLYIYSILLRNNYLVLQYINIFSPLVAIGIVAASLSASLSNSIGASRVLQAVAKDNLFGKVVKTVHYMCEEINLDFRNHVKT